MSGRGHVIAVSYRSTRAGRDAWQVETDYDAPVGGDGLKRTAFWIPHDGPRPQLGDWVEWSPHSAWWGLVKVHKLEGELDPGDPSLFTG